MPGAPSIMTSRRRNIKIYCLKSSIPECERPRHKPSLTTDNNYYNRPVYYGSIYEVSSRPTCRLRLHVFELDLLNSIGSGFLRVLDLTALL